MVTRRSREAKNVANAKRLYTMSLITLSNTLEMSDGDAALTDTLTGRVHAIARAAFSSSCASFRERMSASVLPIWSADIEGITGGRHETLNRSCHRSLGPHRRRSRGRAGGDTRTGHDRNHVHPGGATFYTSTDTAQSSATTRSGPASPTRSTPILGVEGEVAGTVGISQDLAFGSATARRRSPDTPNYSANLVVSASTRTSLVPYVTDGVRGLTMFERAPLGINDTGTLLTGNVGGGVKWYASNGRWGLRGDYRFTAVRDKDDAPSFFGRDTRYGHRVYGGLIIDVVR
jgi:hypothetical protein